MQTFAFHLIHQTRGMLSQTPLRSHTRWSWCRYNDQIDIPGPVPAAYRNFGVAHHAGQGQVQVVSGHRCCNISILLIDPGRRRTDGANLC
jgi:hypothetical protein